MPQTFVTTFIVLCFLGILDSGYLVWKHRKNSHTPLVCPLDHDCSKVTESKWSHIFGVRNEILGVLFYAVLLVTVIAKVSNWPFSWDAGLFDMLLVGATALGTLFSLFLLYVQFKIIKDYCFYCLLSTLITLLLLVNSSYILQNILYNSVIS